MQWHKHFKGDTLALSSVEWDRFCLTWQLIGILYYANAANNVTNIYTTYTSRFKFNLC